jgi:hypothetical protein
MSRIDQQIGPYESIAAKRITELGEEIQELVYYLDAQGVPPATVRALHKAYRVVKATTIFYSGDNHPLIWDPPEFHFQKRGAK